MVGFGTLLTNFRHIKPGLLHRANGGYLLVDTLRAPTTRTRW
jgi:predicted ATP-dependent protease